MEIWDLYTKDRILSGMIILRGEKIPYGLFHLEVHFWPKDEKGRYLIQKRANHLKRLPGIWAETGGSVIAGETSIDAMKREILEEIGLDIPKEKLICFNSITRNDSIVDFWTTKINSEIKMNFIPTEEVSEIDFKYPEEITGMIANGNFYRFSIEYLKIIGVKVDA